MRALAIAAALLVLRGALPARATPSDVPVVVLVGGDAAFDEALADVLVERRVEAVGTMQVPPLGELAVRSRDIARASSAVATVWLTPASRGATLVTYDVEKDRFLVRELSYPLPLSATQAAEAARMVKTMLRALRADDDEAMVRAAPARIETKLEMVRSPMFAAAIGGGVWLAAPQATAAPQLMLLAAWRPDDVGAALMATLAPSGGLDTGTFSGTVGDVVIAGEARKALRVAPRLRVTPGVGVALHVLSVEGIVAGGSMLASHRYDPAGRVEVVTALAVPYDLEVGIAVSADCLLRRQRYEVENQAILLVSRVQLMTAAFVGFRM